MTNIFVANLDFGITSEDLKATFSQFGIVEYAHVVYDNKTKKSKGYGYVEMPEESDANNAVAALHGIEVNGRILDIKIATPKDQRVKSPKPSKSDKPKFNKFNKEDGFKSKRPFNSESSYNKDYSSFNKEKKEDTVKVKENRVMRPRRKRMGE
ncbi:MAG: hypothetical protein H3C31_04230 [Brumimicrobium sp.]|nr:hypothetical protein [Brumimicrobium sp.]MCO5268878.1 RNA-binding protein [Brumimicrobium sp.]